MSRSFVRIFIALLIAALTFPSVTLQALTFADTSRLASGRWVKVRVDSDGVWRLSASTLASLGFMHPERVSVAGYGSVGLSRRLPVAPDDLPLIPVHHTPDAIYFFAEGDTRVSPSDIPSDSEPINHYSTGSYYFITESPDFISPEPEIVAAPVLSALTDGASDATHTELTRVRYRDGHPYGASAFTFSRDFSRDGAQLVVSVPVRNFAGNGRFNFTPVGLADVTAARTLPVDFNGDVTVVSDASVRGSTSEHTIYLEGSRGSYRFDRWTEPEFRATISSPGGMKNLRIRHATLAYDAFNRFHAPQSLWYYSATAAESFYILDAPARLEAWDVSDPRSPLRHEVVMADPSVGAVSANPHGLRNSRLCLFTPSDALPEPQILGAVPAQNLHSMQGGDILIVSNLLCLPAARRLATLHASYQGLKADVVLQDDIFNEFSSGAFHPEALRRFVSMLYGRSGGRMRYLVLMGVGTGSPIGEECAPAHLTVTFHTEDSEYDRSDAKNYASDAYFGCVADRAPSPLADPTAEFPVMTGRIPAVSLAEAEMYVDKCREYFSEPQSRGVPGESVLFAGHGNSSMHFDHALRQARIIDSLSVCAVPRHASISLFPAGRDQADRYRDNLRHRFAGLPFYILYSGHGSARGFEIYVSDIFMRSVRFGSHPFAMLASCDNARIDFPEPGIGSQLVCRRDGPIAVVAATRSVYLDYNHVLADSLLAALSAMPPGTTFGEIFSAACARSLAATRPLMRRDRMINNLSFNLLGDPALPACIPSRTVSASLHSPIEAGVPVTLSGTVNKPDGSPDGDFTGTLSISLFGPPREVVTTSPSSSDPQRTVALTDDELLALTARVESGRWETSIILPEPQQTSLHRLRLYAVSQAGDIAVGSCDDLTLLPCSSNPVTPADADAPEVTISIEGHDPELNLPVPPSFSLSVSAADHGSGLDLATWNLGNLPSVRLDGRPVEGMSCGFTPGADGVYTSRGRVSGLADGEHTLTAVIRDAAGNTARESLRFVVADSVPVSLEVAPAVVRDEAVFSVSHPFRTLTSAGIDIFDAAGRRVFSASPVSFPFEWDLRDLSGAPVPDGRYTARVILSSSPRSGAASLPFTVVKRVY